MIKIHDEDIGDKCLLCGKKYKHRVTYSGNKWLKEAEIITHCANCRVLLRKIKNTSELLKRLETDAKFFSIMRDFLVFDPV